MFLSQIMVGKNNSEMPLFILSGGSVLIIY